LTFVKYYNIILLYYKVYIYIKKYIVNKKIRKVRKKKYKKLNLVRIPSNSKDYIIDYDKEQCMYKVSLFDEDSHFKNEYWFKEYRE